jgi:hypothetical protein
MKRILLRFCFFALCCAVMPMVGMDYSQYTKQDLMTFFGTPSNNMRIMVKPDGKFYTSSDMKQLAGFYPDQADDFLAMDTERFIPLSMVSEDNKTILPCVYVPHAVLFKSCTIGRFIEEVGGKLNIKRPSFCLTYSVQKNGNLLRDIAQKIELEKNNSSSLISVTTNVGYSTSTQNNCEQLAWKNEMYNARLEEIRRLKWELNCATNECSRLEKDRKFLGALLFLSSGPLLFLSSGIIFIYVFGKLIGK